MHVMRTQHDAAARTWVLALTSVASVMVALDTLVVTTALTTIRLDLGASIEELEWTVNAYNLSFAVLLMTAAVLGDRFGRRRMFAAGLGLFVAASAACGLATGVGWLIAARTVQGAGAALVMPLALALLTAAFPPERRGWALGIFSGVTGLATIGGPVLGGAVAEGVDWRWIFWLNLPIGLIAIPLVLRRIPESFGPAAALDLRGLLLVTGAAFGLVWGLVRGHGAGWSSVEVTTSLWAGALLGVAFVLWEQRARAPMVPLRLFRSRAFSAGNAANFFLFAAIFGAVFFLAQFLQTAQGHRPLAAGIRLLPWTAVLLIVAPVAGSLADRIGERALMVSGLMLQALGLGWIALMAAPDLPYLALVPPLVISGCGASAAMPAANASIMGGIAADDIGKASGTLSMLRELGGVFGIAILVAVFTGAGGVESARTFTQGFAPAMGVCATFSLAGALCGLCGSGVR